jgi:glutamate/tyrosine decarboxylase-like PLP-dependent enzyme
VVGVHVRFERVHEREVEVREELRVDLDRLEDRIDEDASRVTGSPSR